jgi:transglutaminase-like putative cysteine protease
VRRWRIVHTTALAYDGRVRAAHNELRMTPVNEIGQTTLENRIRIRPMTWSHVYRDHWGTHVMAMESLAEHQRLDIEAISTVERTDVERHEPSLDWKAVRDPAVQDRSFEWLMLSARTRPGRGIAELADAVRGLPTPRAAAEELSGLVRSEMKYQPGATGVHSRGEDAWAERSGVCQDFAHITVGALRSLGVPARYVSGYLVPKKGSAVGETSKGESHAWVEFWDDGWIPCDPTNGAEVGPDHVVVARGRDYEDVPPFKGIYSGRAKASLEVVVAITRLA